MSEQKNLPTFGRRKFLGMLGKGALAVAGAGLTACTPSTEQSAQPTKTPEKPVQEPKEPTKVKPTEAPTKPKTEQPVFQEYPFPGGTLFINETDQIPVKVVYGKGSQARTVNYDRDRMLSLRQNSEKDGFYNLVDLIDLKEPPTPTPNSTDRPIIEELLKDTLSDKELEKRGIKIIQSDNTKLYIRRSAFEEGQPLAHYQEDSKKKLTIVLLNAPVMSRRCLDKYPQFSSLFPDGYFWDDQYKDQPLEDFRQQIVGRYTELEKKLIGLIEQTQKIKNTEGKIEEEKGKILQELQSLLLETQCLQFLFQRATPEDLNLARMFYDKENGENNPSVGVHFRNPKNPNESYIFATVGKGAENITNKKRYCLYYNEVGKLSIKEISVGFFNPKGADKTPKSTESYPRASDFKEEIRQLRKKYFPLTAGLILRHEINHDHPLSSDFDPNDESQVEEKAVSQFEAAWQRWVENGDNTGYCFIFSLPEGGGYILTKREESSTTPSRNV